MKKISTDFSQITLLSNQKAKDIYQKNSKQNNEHVKLCKSFERAKHGIRTSHGKKKKDMEKRLERHHQDSLNVDDIKSLRKYVGDARDESEFYSQFIESGRTRRKRSFSALSNKERQPTMREMSKLEARKSSIRDLGKDMEFVPKAPSKVQRVFPKQDMNTDLYRDGPRREERDKNLINFAKSGKVDHGNHTRTRAEGTADVECCKNRSPKVQRKNVVKKHRAAEMLSGLTVNSALQTDIAMSPPKGDPTDSTRETSEEAGEGEEFDENNNFQEDRGSNSYAENQDNKVRQLQSKTVDQFIFKVNPESTESSNASPFSQQRKDPKKGPVILKRLGPTPDECEEEVDEETLQDEKEASSAERQYPRQRKSSLITVNGAIEKSRESVPASQPNAPVRRRRSSWAGPRSVTDRLFKREFPEALPQIDRNFEAQTGAEGSPDLDNFDKASQKSFESAPNDAVNCENTTVRRRHRFENLEAVKREFFHRKSNSVPVGLGSKVKIYSEEPFYMRPRRLSRRPSWQSINLSDETLQGLQEIADKAKRDEETEPEPQTPLVSILPPITLQTIYAQQCSREKREQELQELRKQRGIHKKIGEEFRQADFSLLTDRLKDCRYLRQKKDATL